MKPLTIEQASLIWGGLAKDGNEKALALLTACAIEAIERRADRAFGIERSEEERNERLKMVQERLAARKTWTDVIKARLEAKGCYDPSSPETRRVFADLTIQVNQALFGQPHFNGDRDTMTPEQQRLISSFETLLSDRANRKSLEEPVILVEKVLSLFN